MGCAWRTWNGSRYMFCCCDQANCPNECVDAEAAAALDTTDRTTTERKSKAGNGGTAPYVLPVVISLIILFVVVMVCVGLYIRHRWSKKHSKIAALNKNRRQQYRDAMAHRTAQKEESAYEGDVPVPETPRAPSAARKASDDKGAGGDRVTFERSSQINVVTITGRSGMDRVDTNKESKSELRSEQTQRSVIGSPPLKKDLRRKATDTKRPAEPFSQETLSSDGSQS